MTDVRDFREDVGPVRFRFVGVLLVRLTNHAHVDEYAYAIVARIKRRLFMFNTEIHTNELRITKNLQSV